VAKLGELGDGMAGGRGLQAGEGEGGEGEGGEGG